MITGSSLLAQYLETSGKGFKAKSSAGQAAAARLNLARAERSILRNAARDTEYSVSNEEISQLIRMTGDVEGRTGASGFFDISPVGSDELGGYDIGDFGRIDANLVAGNSQEQNRTAQRQRSNLLAGRPLDAAEIMPDAPQPLADIALPELNLGFLKGTKGKTIEQIQKENPLMSDVDIQKQFDTRDELLKQIEGFSKNAQFSTDPLVKDQNARARDKAMAMLSEIGYDAEAQELMKTGSQALADTPSGAVAVDDPATPQDESMSPANTAVFDDKIGAIDMQIRALSRGMARAKSPKEKEGLIQRMKTLEKEKAGLLQKRDELAQPTLHRGSQQYAGTRTSTRAAGTAPSAGATPTAGVTSTGIPTPEAKKTETNNVDIGNAFAEIDTAEADLKAKNPALAAAMAPRFAATRSALSKVQTLNDELMATLPVEGAAKEEFESEKAEALLRQEKQEAIAAETARIKVQTAENVKEANEQAIADAKSQTQADADEQRQQNIEDELSMKTQLFALGLLSDTRGLEKLHSTRQKGIDKVRKILNSGDAAVTKLRTAMLNDYSTSMDKAMNEYDAQILKIQEDTDAEIEAEEDEMDQDEEKRATALRTILTGKYDKEEAAAKAAADAAEKAYDKVVEAENKVKDDARADATSAMSSLLTLRGQGVKGLAGNALKALEDKLPGIDVNALLSAPTDEQIRDLQKSVGDMGTSSADFTGEAASIMDGANLSAYRFGTEEESSQFKQIVARKLREGSGDNTDAKNYLFTALANELKGTALTEYDAREEQIIRVDGILQGMKDDPDFVYSKPKAIQQELLSHIGKEDPAYTALSAPISELSAEIVHGLSGAAVSPAEFRRLKTFLPKTGEGVDVLTVKLGNLKKYATWINQAKIARLANMPVPPDPTLTKEELKAQEGEKKEWKGSNEGINEIVEPSTGSGTAYVDSYRITQAYGSTWDMENGFMKGKHNAVDLAPKVRGERTPVTNAAGGKVIAAIRGDKGLGNHVKVQDDEGRTFIYGHLENIDVEEGDYIEGGLELGIMGKSGSTDGGVHLHFEIRDKNGNPIDPTDFIS